MTAHADALRYHRLDQQHQSEGFTPEEIRDYVDAQDCNTRFWSEYMGFDTFDGMVHASGPLPVALGLLCEGLPSDDGRPRMYWTPDHVIVAVCGAGLVFTDPPFAGDAECEAMPTAAEDAAFAGETAENLCPECDQPMAPDEFWCSSCWEAYRDRIAMPDMLDNERGILAVRE